MTFVKQTEEHEFLEHSCSISARKRAVAKYIFSFLFEQSDQQQSSCALPLARVLDLVTLAAVAGAPRAASSTTHRGESTPTRSPNRQKRWLHGIRLRMYFSYGDFPAAAPVLMSTGVFAIRRPRGQDPHTQATAVVLLRCTAHASRSLEAHSLARGLEGGSYAGSEGSGPGIERDSLSLTALQDKVASMLPPLIAAMQARAPHPSLRPVTPAA